MIAKRKNRLTSGNSTYLYHVSQTISKSNKRHVAHWTGTHTDPCHNDPTHQEIRHDGHEPEYRKGIVLRGGVTVLMLRILDTVLGVWRIRCPTARGGWE